LEIGDKHIKHFEQQLSIRHGTILEHLQKIWEAIKQESPSLIQHMETEYPESKIAKRILNIIPKRAKAFRKIGLHY